MGDLKIVQFVHPGFEYHKREHVGPKTQRVGVMGWKQGGSRHDRKFMWSHGSAFDPQTDDMLEDVPLTFWGEWEGPSVFWRIDSPGKLFPSIVHAPFRPADVPMRSVQNTDPIVFGDSFIYTNCRQGPHPVLRSLPPGSLILFGRLGREDGGASFSLDTCFVVDRVQPLPAIPFESVTYGEDLVQDAALCPLFAEGGPGELGVHFGRSRAQGEVFSFFPAQPSAGKPSLFVRPELRPVGWLAEIISPGTQGVKITHGVDERSRDAIWHAVVEQVAEQGCSLGYEAAPPPMLDEFDARRAADGNPAPVMGSRKMRG
jgi:hypothetical protein